MHFVSAKINKNPVIKQLLENNKKFRDRKKLNSEISNIEESLRNKLVAFNTRVDTEFEKKNTIRCSISSFLKINQIEQE